MKKLIGLTIVVFIAATQAEAQTSSNVDFSTLHLQIALKCFTNLDSGASTVGEGAARITAKDLIAMLSGRRSFPLGRIFDGNGTPIPHLGAALMTNFSSNAKLLLLQALGTNHGDVFIVVRDGHPSVDYDVSEYFTFEKRGFESSGTNQVIRSAKNPNNPETTALYLQEVTFDNTASGGGGDRVAFAVDGLAKERRGPVTVKGEIIDSEATRALIADVAGTGSLTNNFAVIQGTIAVSGATHETK